MTYSPDLHHRRSLRLRGYDYSQAGAYFVTICAKDRACLFGEVEDGAMRLNDAGRRVGDTWAMLPTRFPSIDVDGFVVMPNHVHGVVVITDPIDEGVITDPNDVGAGLALPQPSVRSAPTLGDAVRAFKSISAIAVNRLLGRLGRPLWQRNYYEHIIRNDSLNRLRQYIIDNPAQWALDRKNPNHR